ncbi:hypothetical protein J5N97_008953 [Dioscorea zingiberensis]|uniref:BHLH domain-containing protein n=1 Tax=Dioscorea zingiberensis TaxID=325984 RepID=A0A9D5CWN9_9LILI|nr:hypothetical protein J5N97_008953 [Dioscorea zingiberensis]
MEGSAMRDKESNSSQKLKKDMGCMERNRREKMTEYYSILQSIVPNLFPKATRTRVIDEAITFIKDLEEVVMALEGKKAARGAAEAPSSSQSNTGSSVSVSITGNTQFFRLSLASKKPGMVTKVLQVFENHNAEILACSVTSHELQLLMSLTVTVPDEAAIVRIKEELLVI